jgi:hypothetical protein
MDNATSREDPPGGTPARRRRSIGGAWIAAVLVLLALVGAFWQLSKPTVSTLSTTSTAPLNGDTPAPAGGSQAGSGNAGP